MAETIKTTVALQRTLLQRAEALARQLNISLDELFAQAVVAYASHHEAVQPDLPGHDGQRTINQGDIYWVALAGDGAEPGIPHPHVVLQDNLFNHSRIPTVVTCALTSNVRRASLPGNVRLEAGEAHLPLQSIVEISKVSTVDKTQLGEYIGTLSEARVAQILAGMRFLQASVFRE